MICRFLTLLLLAMALSGCSVAAPSAAPKGHPTALRTDLPLVLILQPGTTTVVPGSEGHIRLTVQDVKNGAVEVSLAFTDGQSILDAVAITREKGIRFRLGNTWYELTAEDIKDAAEQKVATMMISTVE
jgi:hypothetical protein